MTITQQSRIIELASVINAQTKNLDEQLQSNGQPPLSFGLDATPELPPVTHVMQQCLLEAIDELQALVQGPFRSMLLLNGFSHNTRISIHFILRFRVAHSFAIGQTTTFPEIAHSCNVDEQDVKRMLRHAMAYRVFEEPRPGVVVHTPASRLLVENQNLVSWLGVVLDELSPAASRTVDAMQRWPRSQEPHESGWNLAHGEKDMIFDVLCRDVARSIQFAGSMRLFHDTPAFSLDHTVNHFDWHSVTKLVDIGGNQGNTSIALARAHPHLHCVVQDLSRFVDGVSAPHELRDRVTFMAHDFFTPQPVRDADVYFLRFTLHDWSDLYAARILRALVPALRAGSRVVINDSCLAEAGTVSLYRQRVERCMDLSMKQIQNGRERDPEDWKMLLELTDQRMRLKQIIRPPGAALAFIVAEWTEV